MKRKVLFFYVFFLSTVLYGQQQLADLALNAQERLFAGVIENRQKQLQRLQDERVEFLKRKEQGDAEVRQLAEDAKTQIALLTSQLDRNKDNEFTRRKLALFNELYPVYKDIERESEKIIGVIDDLIGV